MTLTRTPQNEINHLDIEIRDLAFRLDQNSQRIGKNSARIDQLTGAVRSAGAMQAQFAGRIDELSGTFEKLQTCLDKLRRMV